MGSSPSLANMTAKISKQKQLEELRQYKNKICWADHTMISIADEIQQQKDILDHMLIKPPTDAARKEKETVKKVIEKNSKIITSVVNLINLMDEKITEKLSILLEY
ncbi:hypothetical protein L1887_01988 [Cichorium endivia]|nr:hypothetical protein L1887_01988 [Cichorium endivia]